jgi:hypothetical protein
MFLAWSVEIHTHNYASEVGRANGGLKFRQFPSYRVLDLVTLHHLIYYSLKIMVFLTLWQAARRPCVPGLLTMMIPAVLHGCTYNFNCVRGSTQKFLD